MLKESNPRYDCALFVRLFNGVCRLLKFIVYIKSTITNRKRKKRRVVAYFKIISETTEENYADT
jgi:hypothetical protein